MASENPPGEWVTTPDNQQERLDPGWVVGFVDGEGCFSVPRFPKPKDTAGLASATTILGCAERVQSGVLDGLVDFFGCGKVDRNRRRDNHREDLLRCRVGRLDDLRTKIVPFFEANPLRTTKRADFEKFARILQMMKQGEHLTKTGLMQVCEVVETMNHRKPSKVLRILRDHTPAISVSGDEEMVRTSWRHEEISGND